MRGCLRGRVPLHPRLPTGCAPTSRLYGWGGRGSDRRSHPPEAAQSWRWVQARGLRVDTSWFAAPRPDPRVHQPAGPAMIEPGPESHASALGNPGAVCVCVCVCVCAGAGGRLCSLQRRVQPPVQTLEGTLRGDPPATQSSRTDLQETWPPAAL